MTLEEQIAPAFAAPDLGQIAREPHRIGTLDIVLDAAWIWRCAECGTSVDQGDELCEECKCLMQ